MSNAMNVIKIIGAWGCLTAAMVLLILQVASGLILPLAVLSVAFAQAPTG